MKIVYSYYVLDILHKGHLIYMRRAKDLVGKDGVSVVGILTDEAVMETKPKPILSLEDRMEIARAIKYIDLVIPQKTYSPIDNLYEIKPDIALESESHSLELTSAVEEAMNEIGGEVFVMPYYKEQSSTQIKKKIKNGN